MRCRRPDARVWTLALVLAGLLSMPGAAAPRPLGPVSAAGGEDASAAVAAVSTGGDDIQDRLPGYPVDAGSPPPPPRLAAARATASGGLAPSSTVGCGFDAMLAKKGSAFVADVARLPWECMRTLFGTAPLAIRTAAFEESNVIAVASAARQRATAYRGGATTSLTNLFYFLQAATYRSYQGQWSPDVHPAIFAAVAAFVANPRFTDYSARVGNLLIPIFSLMDSPTNRLPHLAVVLDWLSHWGRVRAQNPGQVVAASLALSLVFGSHSETGFKDVVARMPSEDVVDVLGDLALGDWMLGTDAGSLPADAARELARFLQYPDLPWIDALRTAVAQVMRHYRPHGRGADVWIAAASVVIYHDACSGVGVCEQIADLERSILPVRHRCDDNVMIRGRDLDERQLAAACDALERVGEAFHWRLRTNREPVADDFTALHEVVAFADYDHYSRWSPLFFGNSTDNGGIYLEGDPSNPGNVSRHLGYVATWLPDRPIWNLEHEYVHHLDGRFNLHGQFGDYRLRSHKTLWWIEGLAEYLSHRDDNEQAVAVASRGTLPLREVFAMRAYDEEGHVYRWTYLAVRFLFERHREQIDELLRHLRVGDYDAYRREVDALAALAAGQWDAWLAEVQVMPDYDVATIAPAFPSALSTFDDEAALAVVDVALAHRTGQGVTVTAVSANPEVVTVAVADGKLTLSAVAIGDATVRVTISDAWGRTHRRLNLEVTGECPRWLCASITKGWRAALATTR